MLTDELKTCPVCGNGIHPNIYEEHVDDCDGLPFTADECPMCGEPYGRYLDHLKNECQAQPDD